MTLWPFRAFIALALILIDSILWLRVARSASGSHEQANALVGAGGVLVAMLGAGYIAIAAARAAFAHPASTAVSPLLIILGALFVLIAVGIVVCERRQVRRSGRRPTGA